MVQWTQGSTPHCQHTTTQLHLHKGQESEQQSILNIIDDCRDTNTHDKFGVCTIYKCTYSVISIQANHQVAKLKFSSNLQANGTFMKEITKACFYYLDKFFLLTSGNELYLYKYHIDTSKPDDIKRCTSLIVIN